MNKISRKGFIKIAAAAAMSGVTAGAWLPAMPLRFCFRFHFRCRRSVHPFGTYEALPRAFPHRQGHYDLPTVLSPTWWWIPPARPLPLALPLPMNCA